MERPRGSAPSPATTGDPLVVRTTFEDDRFVVSLHGEMDLGNVADARRALADAEASTAREILVDLSSLRFIDSTGVHLLIDAAQRSAAAGGRLGLVRGGPAIRRVFEICGIDEFLPWTDTVLPEASDGAISG